MSTVTQSTCIEICGVEREIEVTFWHDEDTNSIEELHCVKLADMDVDISGLIMDDEIKSLIIDALENTDVCD